jgi:hypothetical protein
MEKRRPVSSMFRHRMKQEVVFVQKTMLKLGKETYGEKDIQQAFAEAFAPYFAIDEKTSHLQQPLRTGHRFTSGVERCKQKSYEINPP